jgi:hypothetical protein
MTGIPLGVVEGPSPHIIDRMIEAKIKPGLVREATGVRGNRIDESIAHLEPPNRGDAA